VNSRRLRTVLMIAVFDIAGPLVAYNLLRSAGLSTVTALVLSGVFPAAGVIIGIIQHRRVDAVGVLVLAGIAVGAILGLVSHNAKLVLDEGSVPTAVFGLICLGSLATPKPLIYRLALEFIGSDSRQGREFTDLWQYKEFRHVFRVMTTVWGTTYLAEAAARVVIVQNTSAGTALAISKVLPYAVAGVLVLWTVGYGRYQKRRGERLAAAAATSAARADAAAAGTDTAPARAAANEVPPGNQPPPGILPAERPGPERP
jgi:intracellular septation protein A